MRKTFAKIVGLVSATILSLGFAGPGAARHHRHQEEEGVSARAPDWPAIRSALKKLEFYAYEPDEKIIIVDPSRQELYLIVNGKIVNSYPVSTSIYGLGNVYNSHKTPYGTLRIREKIGAGEKLYMHFEDAKSTGKTKKHGGGITSRILWLTGQEAGVNADPRINNDNFDKMPGHVDTYYRNIYIHGTPTDHVGSPGSIGCITMTNRDVIELFDQVPVGTLVEVLHKEYIAQGTDE